MKYSYEYKKQYINLYRQVKWPEIPAGVNQEGFHKKIRELVRIEEAQGSEAL